MKKKNNSIFNIMRENKNIYSKFLGLLTKNGSKTKAKQILDSSFIKSFKKTNVPAYIIAHKTFSKLNFFLEIKKIRRRKNIHLVPFPLTNKRRDFLKIK
jgi:ribosomal protein S7